MKASYILIITLALGLWACSPSEQETTDQQELIKTINVETVEMKPQTFSRYLRLIGTVEAANDVRLAPQVSGRIIEYFVQEGQAVSKGQAIAKIDDEKLEQEKARLKAQTIQAREQYQRLERIFEQDSIGSEIDVINARTMYEQSKSALESIKVDLANTTVRAPFDAVLEDIIVEEGEMASPSIAMIRLIASDQIKIEAGVPARYADVVHTGDEAGIWFDTQNSDTLNGSITYVAGSIDPEARTFGIEIAIPEKDQNYKIDMITNVRLRTLQKQGALVMGKEYVYQKDDGYVVYTVSTDQNGQTIASEQPVVLGASYENNVVVEAGLQLGDRLITVGSSYLQDGVRVNVVDNQSRDIAQQVNEE